MALRVATELARVLVIETISAAYVVPIEALVCLVAVNQQDGRPTWIEGVEDADGGPRLHAEFAHVGVSRAVDLGGVGVLKADASFTEGADDMEAGVLMTTTEGLPPVAKLMGELDCDGHSGSGKAWNT